MNDVTKFLQLFTLLLMVWNMLRRRSRQRKQAHITWSIKDLAVLTVVVAVGAFIWDQAYTYSYNWHVQLWSNVSPARRHPPEPFATRQALNAILGYGFLLFGVWHWQYRPWKKKPDA